MTRCREARTEQRRLDPPEHRPPSSMRAKVLYVIDNLEFGGGGRVLSQLAGALKDRYEILFACQPGGLLEERLRPLGIPVRPLNFRHQLSLLRILRLSAIIRGEGVHVVHSMGVRADFSARIAAWLAGAPVVVSTVAMLAEGYEVSPVKRVLYRAAVRWSERLSSGFIAVSETVRKALVEDHRVPEEKVVRIHNSGVELEAFRPGTHDGLRLRRELGLDPEAPVVGTIGRLVSQKAQDVFLRAAALVAEAVPDVQFLIVGDGPLRPSLERMAVELGLGRCAFAGVRADIPGVLSILDVFVLSSVLEGLPVVLLEALAAARPVVATRIEGVTEVLQHGATGLLVPPRDPGALADAILALLRDGGLARRLGEAGRKVAEERFPLARAVDEVDRFYATLLQRKGLR